MQLARITAFVAMALFATTASADPTSHRQAVEDLLVAMHTESVMQRSLDTVLDMQVQANPAVAPFRATMAAFFRKYMGWEAIKQDYIALYMEAFTEAEVKDLIKFYGTKTGKKSAVKVPELMAKGAEIGQRQVQAHMPELLKMLEEAAKANQGAAPAGSKPKPKP